MNEQELRTSIEDREEALEQYEAAMERFEPLEIHIRTIASKMIKWSQFNRMENVNIRFDDDDVSVSWTEWWKGDDDDYHVYFPISYLWDENWHEKHLAYEARKVQQAEVEKARKEADKARKAEERRRAQYLKLKEEFENASPEQD